MGMLLFVTGCSSDDSGDSEPVAPDASPQDFVFPKQPSVFRGEYNFSSFFSHLYLKLITPAR